jgi:serine/threonine-protein kinase RsbT
VDSARGQPGEFIAQLEAALDDVVGPILAKSVAGWVRARLGDVPLSVESLRATLQRSIYLTPQQVEAVIRRVGTGGVGAAPRMSASPPRVVAVNSEHDIVEARTVAKKLAEQCGFDLADAVKVATVVSELARNIVLYARTGRIELEVVSMPKAGIRVVASDDGPGIPNLDAVLSGKYRSKTGMGLGIVGSKRLMDQLSVDSSPGRGTRITAVKYVVR